MTPIYSLRDPGLSLVSVKGTVTVLGVAEKYVSAVRQVSGGVRSEWLTGSGVDRGVCGATWLKETCHVFCS